MNIDVEKFIAFLKTRHESEERDIVAVGITRDVAQIILDYSHIALESATYMASWIHKMDVYAPQPNSELNIVDILTLAAGCNPPTRDVRLILDPSDENPRYYILYTTIRGRTYYSRLYLTVILNHINHGGFECLSRRILKRLGQIDPISQSGFINAMNILCDNIVWVRYSLYDSVTYREAINDFKITSFKNARHKSIGLAYSGDSARYGIYPWMVALMCVRKNDVTRAAE